MNVLTHIRLMCDFAYFFDNMINHLTDASLFVPFKWLLNDYWKGVFHSAFSCFRIFFSTLKIHINLNDNRQPHPYQIEKVINSETILDSFILTSNFSFFSLWFVLPFDATGFIDWTKKKSNCKQLMSSHFGLLICLFNANQKRCAPYIICYTYVVLFLCSFHLATQYFSD